MCCLTCAGRRHDGQTVLKYVASGELECDSIAFDVDGRELDAERRYFSCYERELVVSAPRIIGGERRINLRLNIVTTNESDSYSVILTVVDRHLGLVRVSSFYPPVATATPKPTVVGTTPSSPPGGPNLRSHQQPCLQRGPPVLVRAPHRRDRRCYCCGWRDRPWCLASVAKTVKNDTTRGLQTVLSSMASGSGGGALGIRREADLRHRIASHTLPSVSARSTASLQQEVRQACSFDSPLHKTAQGSVRDLWVDDAFL